MGNKYGSNVRTYVARNLIWNGLHQFEVVPTTPSLYTLAPPATLPVNNDTGHTAGKQDDMFFRNQIRNRLTPTGQSWNHKSNLNVKRMGVFSNFADGLVLSNTDTRLSLILTTYTATITQYTGSVPFVTGHNYITGATGLSSLPIIAGDGSCISDNALIENASIYTCYVTSDTAAQLSDFAFSSVTNTKVYGVNLANPQTYYLNSIPALNTLYDTEIFLRSGIDAAAYTAGARTIIMAQLALEGATVYNFYTKTIDTTLTYNVSFDAVLEIELTPA